MRRVTWSHQAYEPIIVVELCDPFGFTVNRSLLADTGAGPANAPFHLVLSEDDCSRFSLEIVGTVGLGGSLDGTFVMHVVVAGIPALSAQGQVVAAVVSSGRLPNGLHGIAGFRFLNSFTLGNFGNPNQFGLETS